MGLLESVIDRPHCDLTVRSVRPWRGFFLYLFFFSLLKLITRHFPIFLTAETITAKQSIKERYPVSPHVWGSGSVCVSCTSVCASFSPIINHPIPFTSSLFAGLVNDIEIRIWRYAPCDMWPHATFFFYKFLPLPLSFCFCFYSFWWRCVRWVRLIDDDSTWSRGKTEARAARCPLHTYEFADVIVTRLISSNRRRSWPASAATAAVAKRITATLWVRKNSTVESGLVRVSSEGRDRVECVFVCFVRVPCTEAVAKFLSPAANSAAIHRVDQAASFPPFCSPPWQFLCVFASVRVCLCVSVSVCLCVC